MDSPIYSVHIMRLDKKSSMSPRFLVWTTTLKSPKCQHFSTVALSTFEAKILLMMEGVSCAL
jgi:hypothetical protein